MKGPAAEPITGRQWVGLLVIAFALVASAVKW